MATVVSKINSNFEKVGSIKVLSSSKTTTEEKNGLIFGGFGYSADINANDGDGYLITIKVISKDGSYKISKKDLNATKTGAKNIIIGNFTFFDFYLFSYSIEKEADSSILILNYKDKSIFMDKLYIGLLNYDYGFSFTGTDIIKEIKPVGVVSRPQRADFQFSCPSSTQATAYIERILKTVETPDYKDFLKKQNVPASYSKFLDSIYFYSKYNYSVDSVNGGYIILGSEVMMEEPCGLPDVDYSFKDLLSALFYSRVPGVNKLSLGDSKIYTDLRRQYKGTLRQVLDQWSSDFGFKFYFQPKITFRIKNYSNLSSPDYEYTINEGLQYLDLISSERTLDELNSLFDPSNPKYSSALQKVIANVSESATLEGTVKNTIITPVRREIRVFSSSSDSSTIRQASSLPLDYLPAFFNIKPSENDAAFKIRGTLMQYDEDLRDIYAINKAFIDAPLAPNLSALGMSLIKNIGTSSYIVSTLNFKGFFAPDVDMNPSDLLTSYHIFLAEYDPAKHKLIASWEKDVMQSFYHQYFKIFTEDNELFCGPYNNFNIQYSTDPESKRYLPIELPFKNLIYGELVNDNGIKLNSTKSKTDPLFQANNVFSETNQNSFNSFSNSFGTENTSKYSAVKSVIFVNLSASSTGKNCFLSCLSALAQGFFNRIQNPNVYLILCPKYSYLNISDISIDGTSTNNSILVASEVQDNTQSSDSNCPKTNCEQNLVDVSCVSTTDTTTSSIKTGFVNRIAQVVRITRNSTNFDLILPTLSDYQYRLTRSNNSTITYPSASFVLGEPPLFNNEDSNVLSFGSIQTNVPEVLTQATLSSGVQDKIITFDSGASGNQVVISSISAFHETAKKSLNNSIYTPQQKRDISLTSTFIPEELKTYIFSNPVLSSMNFSLGEQGFSMNFSFASRPKFRKQADAVFLAQRFLKIY